MPHPHNPFAGETPFPIAGEGVVLKFSASDIARLHAVYGPDTRKPPDLDGRGNPIQTFWTTISGWLSLHDPVVVHTVLKYGLKERNAAGKLVPIHRDEEWWEYPPFAYSEIADQLEAALIWSRWGETPESLAERLREQVEAQRLAALEGDGEDPTMRMPESPTSSGSSSAPTNLE
jgi:hypothetical protein